MKTVTRFEANLLRLLHFFLQKAPVQQALPLIETRIDAPDCLSPQAIELVKDTLAKGCVMLMVRRGAWRKERFLRNDQPVDGRLWERTSPEKLGLKFSELTLEFLMWITERDPRVQKKNWKTHRTPTLGDLVFFAHVHEMLSVHDIRHSLFVKKPFVNNPLERLLFPNDFDSTGNDQELDFSDWVTGVGACIIEALQPMLADQWMEIELAKVRITRWDQMRSMGESQHLALSNFLNAVEKAERLDLARFLLPVAARVLTANANGRLWTNALRNPPSRLSERAATYNGALAFVRQMPRLQQWERNARTIGYFDEGYQASQLWKASWERYNGDVLTERAQNIIRELDPMRQNEE